MWCEGGCGEGGVWCKGGGVWYEGVREGGRKTLTGFVRLHV